MPQLDFTIVFSQIFWLFAVFFTFYTTLVHFFLPKFLMSIKSRKQIVELNVLKALATQKELTNKQNSLQKTLIISLVLIKKTLDKSWFSILKSDKNPDLILVDKKISLTAFYITQYCDIESLRLISLYPRLLSLKSN